MNLYLVCYVDTDGACCEAYTRAADKEEARRNVLAGKWESSRPISGDGEYLFDEADDDENILSVDLMPA